MKEIRYELVAKFEEGELKWEFETLKEAKEQYESVKHYEKLVDLKCNEIVITKTNLF